MVCTYSRVDGFYILVHEVGVIVVQTVKDEQTDLSILKRSFLQIKILILI